MSADTFGNLASVIADNGDPPVPIRQRQKNPAIDGWTTYEFKEADARKFRTCGVGLLMGEVGAIDADVRDPELADKLRRLAVDTLRADALTHRPGTEGRAAVPRGRRAVRQDVHPRRAAAR